MSLLTNLLMVWFHLQRAIPGFLIQQNCIGFSIIFHCFPLGYMPYISIARFFRNYSAHVSYVWFLHLCSKLDLENPWEKALAWAGRLPSSAQQCQSTALAGNIILLARNSAEWSSCHLLVGRERVGWSFVWNCMCLWTSGEGSLCCKVKQVTSELLKCFSASRVWDIFLEMKLNWRQ